MITKHFFCLVLCLLAAALETPSARADERDDKIRALEQRVEQLEKLLREHGLVPGTPQPPPAVQPMPGLPAAPQTRSTAEATLEPEVKAVPGPSLSVGASGFTLQSADTNFVLRLRGLLQVDYHQFFGGGLDDYDTFLLRRARPILQGTVFRDFDFRLAVDFAGSSPKVRGAYLNYRLAPALQVRVGNQKAPLSLERWQSSSNIKFVERSLPSTLTPTRSVGAMLHGELWPGDKETTRLLAWKGVLNYALGAFNTVADTRSTSSSDFGNSKMLAARLFVHPFLKSEAAPLRAFGLGVAGTYGQAQGKQALPSDLAYGTVTDQEFFFYTNGVVADGPQWRLVPQAYYYLGPFSLLGEYVITSPEVRIENAAVPKTRLFHAGWAVTASWLLTGERARFGRISPRRRFDPRQGGWGAWEVVARYSRFDLDDDAFPIFSNPSASASGVSTWGVGLNWYLNQNVRLDLDYLHAEFDGAHASSFAGQDENILLSRVQLSF